MRRPTVILLIIFLLLGALVWYMQQPENPLKKALATSTILPPISMDGKLISPDKGPISLISIQDATGKTITIDKTSGQWIVKAEQSGPADPSLAESAAGQALDLPIIKKLDNVPDQAGTGLDKPVYIISLMLADASRFTFKIGKPTVTDSGYYAETPDGKVIILSKSEVDALTYNSVEPPLLKSASQPSVSETETNIISTATNSP